MHIIWDWNGTLLDDVDVVVESVNLSLERIGWNPITLDEYRTHYTRPVKRFYERLAGRPVTEWEWQAIDDGFHDVYQDALGRLELAGDAAAALEVHASLGATQSLLSMYPHDDLIPLVRRFRLEHHFTRIDGLRGVAGSRKDASLRAHLSAIPPRQAVMIGDTPDDLTAAITNDLPCVLYDGGGHHRDELESLGAPVAGTLVEAAQMARNLVGG